MQTASVPVKPLLANPYIVGRPLTGPTASLYVGREDTFDWFHENLSGTQRPNALLLHGQRRIGKTSTLYQLIEGERGRSLREDLKRPVIPAYIDLQRLAGRPTDEWLRRLARDICNRINTSGLDRSTPDSAVKGETSYAAFDRCLDRLEDTIPAESLILLALDELEQIQSGILGGTLDADVLPFLRSQIQHRSRIAFLLAGSKGLLDDFWWPIVDLAARCELRGLDYAQTEQLIRCPLEGILDYESQAVDLIWHHTGGHPFLIQSICHRLVSQVNRRHAREFVRVADVEQVVEQMQSERFAVDVGLSGAVPPEMPKGGALP